MEMKTITGIRAYNYPKTYLQANVCEQYRFFLKAENASSIGHKIFRSIQKYTHIIIGILWL